MIDLNSFLETVNFFIGKNIFKFLFKFDFFPFQIFIVQTHITQQFFLILGGEEKKRGTLQC